MAHRMESSIWSRNAARGRPGNFHPYDPHATRATGQTLAVRINKLPVLDYGIRQKECNKHATAALISAAYRVPRLSLCVRRTLTLSLKVRRLVKHCNPCAIEGLRRFSCENVACFAELQHVGKNHGAFGKKCRNTLPAQIQSQTIKMQCISY